MRVVALFRVSTERQASEGASLDAQERIYREMAARSGWETVAEFRGHESATQATSDRRVLQQVLACLREQRPGMLYVHEQSRLTRGDELEVAGLLRELRENRIKINVQGVVRDLDSIDERFMVGIQSLVDRAEAERFKERWMRGKREKARQGKRTTGRIPYGYAKAAPGSPQAGTLVVLPEQAAVVRKVFALAAEGKGDQRIAGVLNGQQIPSPGGSVWSAHTVRQMLRRVVYLGTTASFVWVPTGKRGQFKYDPTNPRAVVRPGTHEPIIDQQTWAAVHGRVKLVRSPTPWLLTGIGVINGHPSRASYSHDQVLYLAPKGVRGGPRLDRDSTDAEVWAAFASLATGPAFVGRLLESARDGRQEGLLKEEIEFQEAQAVKGRRRLERLVTLYADGDITREMFLSRRDDTERAVAAAEAELATLRGRAMATDGSQAARVVRAVQVLLAGRTRLTLEQKRQVLRSIVREVHITAERVGPGQRRDEGGRLAGATPWRVASVSFTLTVPEAGAGGEDAGVGAGGGGGGARGREAAQDAARGDEGRCRGDGGAAAGCGAEVAGLRTGHLISNRRT